MAFEEWLEHLTAIYVLEGIKRFGPQKFRILHEHRIRPQDILAYPSRLPLTGKTGDMLRQQIAAEATRLLPDAQKRARRQAEVASGLDASILTYDDPDYPQIVYRSNNPIPVLYVRGDKSVLRHSRAVACVGSRSIRGAYSALHSSFARVACSDGFVVVAGFALGADTLGHEAAIDSNGRTLCVMPCGLDRPFPPENRVLWDRLLTTKKGAFVSEFGFGRRAEGLTLRKRNKLIVAASLGVLVSQSAASGGAMNAFRAAAEQKKPVATFAHDGTDETSGNELIAASRKAKITVFSNRAPDEGGYREWLQKLSSSI